MSYIKLCPCKRYVAVIHTVKGFGIVNKAEIDVFLELSCFFHDPTDVGNLVSGFSAFSKTQLNIWKFMVRVLLKPGLKNFKHYFTSMWDGCNCRVVRAFFGVYWELNMLGCTRLSYPQKAAISSFLEWSKSSVVCCSVRRMEYPLPQREEVWHQGLALEG